VRSDYTYSIFPPFHGTNDVQGFYDALKKATQMNGTGDQIISALANGSVLIINDLELFWERTAEGLEIINLLERLIDTYGQRILFVINVNPHTYKIINQLTDFSDGFIEIINLSPFDAKEIKELVLGRHRSSGLSIKYKSSEEEISDLQLAQLFNSYFNYSQGNPGTALNSWLAHITKVSEKGLLIEKPDTPPLSGLQELNEEWTMLLTQFVFHKRLTVEKIIRIISWDQMEIEKLLLALLRCGIIEERSTGVYHVNPYVHPFLVMALKEKEILR